MANPSDWKERFLTALAARPDVRSAAIVAGVSRATPYEARQRDPDFAAAWGAILSESAVTAAALTCSRHKGASGADAPPSVHTAAGMAALTDWGVDTSGKTLYIVREGWRNLCKIGVSADAKGRVSSIQSNMPQPSMIIALFRSKRGRALESFIHERFAVKRFRGEWFALTDADIRHIARVHQIFCEADGSDIDTWLDASLAEQG